MWKNDSSSLYGKKEPEEQRFVALSGPLIMQNGKDPSFFSPRKPQWYINDNKQVAAHFDF